MAPISPSIHPISFTSIVPPTDDWIAQFAKHRQHDGYALTKAWFYDTFDWDVQSIWIGRIKSTIYLPPDEQDVKQIISRLLQEIAPFKRQVFINFHYLIQNDQPIIEYLMICNDHQTHQQLQTYGICLMFDQFQITRDMLENDHLITRLFDDYLAYSGLFQTEQLKHEINNWDLE